MCVKIACSASHGQSFDKFHIEKLTQVADKANDCPIAFLLFQCDDYRLPPIVTAMVVNFSNCFYLPKVTTAHTMKSN